MLSHISQKVVIRLIKLILPVLVLARVAVIIRAYVNDNNVTAPAEVPLRQRFNASSLLKIGVRVILHLSQ